MKIDFRRVFLIIFLLIVVPAVFFIAGWIGHVIFEERTITKIDASPSDQIHAKDITWRNDSVCFKVNGVPTLAAGIGNSMKPTFGGQANIVEIEIKNENDVHMGDIVEYYSPAINDYVLHRIFEIKEDEFGRYYVMKGDNNDECDPEKIRFPQLKKIVAAIIY